MIHDIGLYKENLTCRGYFYLVLGLINNLSFHPAAPLFPCLKMCSCEKLINCKHGRETHVLQEKSSCGNQDSLIFHPAHRNLVCRSRDVEDLRSQEDADCNQVAHSK